MPVVVNSLDMHSAVVSESLILRVLFLWRLASLHVVSPKLMVIRLYIRTFVLIPQDLRFVQTLFRRMFTFPI